ncbi:hypothetical protein B0H10DRAFT_1999091 [Mycena sp. CBHHK59/15]|nr:hypothetical protein B0H10DRAFT_1999091 [Mycena sp. CBHHK59/15]
MSTVGCFTAFSASALLISPPVSVVGRFTVDSARRKALRSFDVCPFAHCLFSLSIFPAVDAFPFTAVLRL